MQVSTNKDAYSPSSQGPPQPHRPEEPGPRTIRLALHVQKRDTYRSPGLNSVPFAPLQVPVCSPYSKTMEQGGGRALQAI
jgi:hypothetical protein